jgi:hypothetical protein
MLENNRFRFVWSGNMNFVVTLLFSHFASKLETANERIMFLDFVHRQMFSHKTQRFGN